MSVGVAFKTRFPMVLYRFISWSSSIKSIHKISFAGFGYSLNDFVSSTTFSGAVIKITSEYSYEPSLFTCFNHGLLVWQTLLMFSILFHHSNVKLPAAWEKWLNLFIVTPRMHGIHHSVLQKETDSNWSSGLTIWDKLHGTFRSFDPPNKIVIGVPAYREKENLVSMLALPFKKQRPTWQFNDEEQVKQ